MKYRILLALCSLLAGCVNTPGTKAIIAPVGMIGFHRFAPVATSEVGTETAVIAESGH